jgi:ABC-type antimicrobial peptide transport system permease subunit
MRSIVYGIEPIDPATYGAVAVVVILAVVAASAGPALRAAGIHPATVLRSE